MLSVSLPDTSLLNVIAWIYLTINATRIISYLPQILAVWRCTDGALSISLLSWGSWVLSHIAAMFYGVLVVHDMPFVLITLINLLGSSCVTAIAMQRRKQWRRKGSLPTCVAQMYRGPNSESGLHESQSLEPMRAPKVRKSHRRNRQTSSPEWNGVPARCNKAKAHRLASGPLHLAAEENAGGVIVDQQGGRMMYFGATPPYWRVNRLTPS